mgnify:CR=1 FL=1
MYQIKNIELTTTQKKHYESIKWLLDNNNRAEGRTTLMAFVFVQLAIENPNKHIEITDHVNFNYKLTRRDEILNKIRSIIHDQEPCKKFEITLNYIKLAEQA